MLTNASYQSGESLNKNKLIPFGFTDFDENNIYSSGVVAAKTLK